VPEQAEVTVEIDHVTTEEAVKQVTDYLRKNFLNNS
jgi:hypothetical protein